MRKTFVGIAMTAVVLGAGAFLVAAQDATTARQELAKVKNHSMPISKHWTLEQVLAMDHNSIMALWKTLPAPAMAEMNGHLMGLVPNFGDDKQQTSSNNYMFDEDSVRGYWLGKTFNQTGPNQGEGYNIWRLPHGKIKRNLQVATSIGPSLIDGKPSFLINYGVYNKGNTLVDEMRKLDDYLFLGAATTVTDGKRNTGSPAHFVLTGPVDEWQPFPTAATPSSH